MAFAYSEKGSVVLRKWNEQRQMEKAVAQRSRKTMREGFAGASISRLTMSMAQMSGALNADLDSALVILRARARSLCANHEYGRRFLSMVATNVVGPYGPTLQVRATSSSGGLDKTANDAIETHWARWGKQCDVRGQMSLAHMLRVAMKGVARDGEALVRVVRNADLPYGMGLQLLEPDRLDETINVRLSNGHVVRLGVEFDSALRPVAYYLKTRHPGENWNVGPAVIERVPLNELYHVFVPERAEQARGYTWMHAILMRSSMLRGYEEAAVIAARIGASKMGFFQKVNDDPTPVLDQLADGKSAASCR